MDKFLEKYNLPKLNEEEAESLNRLITPDEIETVIKKLLTHRSPGPDSFTGGFCKAFKGELTPILQRLFQKIQEDRRLPNSFYEDNNILYIISIVCLLTLILGLTKLENILAVTINFLQGG